MLSLISGTGRTPNKYSFFIVDMFKGLHTGTRLGNCVFPLCLCISSLSLQLLLLVCLCTHNCATSGCFPLPELEVVGRGLDLLFSVNPLGCPSHVSLPNPLLLGLRGRRMAPCYCLPPCSMSGFLVCVISHHFNNSMG